MSKHRIKDDDLVYRFFEMHSIAAFEGLYKIYFPQLCKFLIWSGASRVVAEDIAQLTFSKIYNKPSLFKIDYSFRSWLFTCAKNEWKNEQRRVVNFNKHANRIAHHYLTEVEDLDLDGNNQRLLAVRQALNHIKEEHRIVFILKYSNNLSIKEIAQICAISEGTVKSRLFYAIKNLKLNLNKSKVK